MPWLQQKERKDRIAKKSKREDKDTIYKAKSEEEDTGVTNEEVNGDIQDCIITVLTNLALSQRAVTCRVACYLYT
jgi:hypothetical protein